MSGLKNAVIEVTRELNVRRNVYPKLVFAGKLSQDEADRRMQSMHYALWYLTNTGPEQKFTLPNGGE